MLKEIYNYLFHKSATLLNREQLGSISLDGMRDKELTENELKERNAKISLDFKIIEQTTKKLLIAQEEFMANQCENEQQLLFARGSINGLTLLLEEFASYKSQHDEITKPKDEFNKFNVI